MSDVERRRVLAALVAWYAPGRVPDLEQGDMADMLAALGEATTEAALVRWAYKRSPDGDLPAGDLAAMGRARTAALEVVA